MIIPLFGMISTFYDFTLCDPLRSFQDACDLSFRDILYFDDINSGLDLYQDDWARDMFNLWTQACLSVAIENTSTHPISDFHTFNLFWVKQWKSTRMSPFVPFMNLFRKLCCFHQKCG